jgi:hypothetical protein
MKLSMYSITVPVMIKALTNLSTVIDKGILHAENMKINPDDLLNEKLIADQFSFGKQVQVSCDNAKGVAARLAGVVAPKHEDNEQTLVELKARIDKTIEYLKTFKEEDIDGSEEKQIPFHYSPDKYMTGFDHVTQYALPNFYFHIVTAYAILRHAGVAIGKLDYIGQINLKNIEA